MLHDVEVIEYDGGTPLEKELMSRCGRLLVTKYPSVDMDGRRVPLEWDVKCERGVVKITCPTLLPLHDNTPYAYVVHMLSLTTPDDVRRHMIRAGGTILDAAWTRTDTGVRVKHHTELPDRWA